MAQRYKFLSGVLSEFLRWHQRARRAQQWMYRYADRSKEHWFGILAHRPYWGCRITVPCSPCKPFVGRATSDYCDRCFRKSWLYCCFYNYYQSNTCSFVFGYQIQVIIYILLTIPTSTKAIIHNRNFTTDLRNNLHI